ncbi:MAG: hypothetical protein AB7U20_04790 [Planctomycetaceae bacterium]
MTTIQWTPEQIAERERQKAAYPPDRRLNIELTAQQEAAYLQAAKEEQASQEEIIARMRKIMAAANEPGFLGDLRRTLNAAGPRIAALPDQIGVDAALLSDFRAGEAELPAAAISRLVDALRLRLMQEIPPAVDKPSRKATA